MTVALGGTLLVVGFSGAFVAGLLGVGGAVVMIPLLLYVPPLLGVGRLDIKAVAGVTMTQVLVAAAVGMLAHRRYGAVNAELAWVGGLAMAVGSFIGALASAHVSDQALLLVFALMVTAAAGLVFVGADGDAPRLAEGPVRFSRTRAGVVAGVVGLAAGLVGAGGAFLLVPLLLIVVGAPIRVTIGTSLAITALAASAGFVGKLVTAQIPLAPTLAVVAGAIPGAQLGAAVSQRVPPLWLRVALFVLVALIAVMMWSDLLSR